MFVLRYASLYFCTGLDQHDNELLALEVLHRYVELLDKYFGNVSFQTPGSKEVLPVGGGKGTPEDWVCFMCINSTAAINVLPVMASDAPRRRFKGLLNQG